MFILGVCLVPSMFISRVEYSLVFHLYSWKKSEYHILSHCFLSIFCRPSKNPIVTANEGMTETGSISEGSRIDSEKHEAATTEIEDARSDGTKNAANLTVNEKRLLRRIDYLIVPWMTLLYLLSFMDRGSIGNAKVSSATVNLGRNFDRPCAVSCIIWKATFISATDNTSTD